MDQRSTRIYSFILTVLFDVYSTTQFHRLLYQLTAVRPAKQLLVLVSRLSLAVVAFADQMWTPTRAVSSVQVSATVA